MNTYFYVCWTLICVELLRNIIVVNAYEDCNPADYPNTNSDNLFFCINKHDGWFNGGVAKVGGCYKGTIAESGTCECECGDGGTSCKSSSGNDYCFHGKQACITCNPRTQVKLKHCGCSNGDCFDTDCASCPPNTYIFQNQCVSCSLNACEDGHYVSKECTMKNSDTVDGNDKQCSLCPQWHYCKDEQKFLCSSGQYCIQGGLVNPTLCAVNHYCPSGSEQISCNEEEGEVCDSEGLTSYVRACRKGKYWSGIRCVATEPGYFSVNDVGVNYHVVSMKNGKEPCAVGTYQPGYGQTNCILCPFGKYSSVQGSDRCESCEPGKYINMEGASECLNCPKGKYTESSGKLLCDVCEPGTYQMQIGSTSCNKCRGKLYQEYGGASSCSVCPSGMTIWCNDDMKEPCKFNDKPMCQSCSAGKYTCSCSDQNTDDFNMCAASKCKLVGDLAAELIYEPCMECPLNHWCPLGTDEPIPHTMPVLGETYVLKRGNSISDNVIAACKKCNPDQFSTAEMDCKFDSDRVCQDCKKSIPYKTYIKDPCTSVKDAVVERCMRNDTHFMPSQVCNPCLPGTRKKGSEFLCEKCPSGTFGVDGLTCQICPANYVSDAGSSHCSVLCPPNSYSSNGDPGNCIQSQSISSISVRRHCTFDSSYRTMHGAYVLLGSNVTVGFTNFGNKGGVLYLIDNDRVHTIAGNALSSDLSRVHGNGVSIRFGYILSIAGSAKNNRELFISDVSVDSRESFSGQLRRIYLDLDAKGARSEPLSLNVSMGRPTKLMIDSMNHDWLWVCDEELKLIWRVDIELKTAESWVGIAQKSPSNLLLVIPHQSNIMFGPSVIAQIDNTMLILDQYVVWSFLKPDRYSLLNYVCGNQNIMQMSFQELGTNGKCSELNLGIMSNMDMSVTTTSQGHSFVVMILKYNEYSAVIYFPWLTAGEREWTRLENNPLQNDFRPMGTTLSCFARTSSTEKKRNWFIQSSSNLKMNSVVSMFEFSLEQELCNEGYYFNDSLLSCVQSPVGTYATAWSHFPNLCPSNTISRGPGGSNSSWCIPCGLIDMTTYNEGDLNCVMECPIGKILDIKTKTCVDFCDHEKGYYYDEYSVNICELCPLGTKATSSMLGIRDACRKCSPGEYGLLPGICSSCPENTTTIFAGSTKCSVQTTQHRCGLDGIYSERVPCSNKNIVGTTDGREFISMSATSSGGLFASDGYSIWKSITSYQGGVSNASWRLKATMSNHNVLVSAEIVEYERQIFDVISMPFSLFEISDDERTLYFTEYGSSCLWKTRIFHEIIDDVDEWKQKGRVIVKGSVDSWIGECNSKSFYEMNGDKFVGRLGAIRDMVIIEKNGFTGILFVSTESADGCMNIRSISLYDGSISTFLSYEKTLFPSIQMSYCPVDEPYRLSVSRGSDTLFFSKDSVVEKINVYSFRKETYVFDPIYSVSWKGSINMCSLNSDVLIMYMEDGRDTIIIRDTADITRTYADIADAGFISRPMSKSISCAGQHIWYISKGILNNTLIREHSFEVHADRGIMCVGGYVAHYSSVCVQVGLGSFKLASSPQIEHCKGGSYGLIAGAGTFMMCKSCPAGKISEEHSVGCESCPISSSLAVDGKRCENSCPVGFYRKFDSMSECIVCPVGHSSMENSVGIQSCFPCKEGFYSNRTSNFTCAQCPLGYTSPIGSFKCVVVCPPDKCAVNGKECLGLVSKYEIITSIQIESKMNIVLAGPANNIFFSDGNKLGYFVDDCPSYIPLNEAGTCIKQGIDLFPPCLEQCLMIGGRGITSMVIASNYVSQSYPPRKYIFMGSQTTFSIYRIPILFNLGTVDVEKTIEYLNANKDGITSLDKWKIAGQGISGFRDGKFEEARFGPIADIILTSNDKYLILTDFLNHRIRIMDLLNQTVKTIIGNGNRCWKAGRIPTFSGATCSNSDVYGLVNFPNGLSRDDNDNIYLAMNNQNAVGRFNLKGVIEGESTVFDVFCALNTNDVYKSGLQMRCDTIADSDESRSCYLYNPFDIAHYDSLLIVAVTEGLTIININTNMCEVAGGKVWEYVRSKARGYVEGGVDESKVNKPFRLSVSKDRGILYLADMENKAIRRLFISGKCNCAQGSLFLPDHRTCYDPTPEWSDRLRVNCSFGYFSFEDETVCRHCSEAFALGLSISNCILWKLYMGSTVKREQLGYSFMRIKDQPFFQNIRNADWYGLSPRSQISNWNDIFRADSHVLYGLGASHGHAPYGNGYVTYTFIEKCVGLRIDDPGCWSLEQNSDLQPKIILPGFWYPCNVNALNVDNSNAIMTCMCPWNIGEFDSPNASSCEKPTWNCLRISAIEGRGKIMGDTGIALSEVFGKDDKLYVKSWSRYMVFGSDQSAPSVCSDKAHGAGPCFPQFKYVQDTAPSNLFNRVSAGRGDHRIDILNHLNPWAKDNISVLRCGVGWPAHYYCPNGYIWIGPNTTNVPRTLFKDKGSHVITCISCLAGSYSMQDLNTKKLKGGPYECIACGGGKYSTKSGASSCMTCPDNTYSSSRNGTGSTSCIQCAPNHFSIAGTWSSLGCTPCSPGTGNCTDCPAGFYQNRAAQDQCLPCAEGYFSNERNQAQCKPCPMGSFQDKSGRQGCEICRTGTFTRGTGATLCETCTPQSLLECSLNINGVCGQGCGLNYYWDLDYSVCKRCPYGSMNSYHRCAKSASVCVDGIDYGKYIAAVGSPESGGDVILACEPGSGASFTTGFSSCEICSFGKFSFSEGRGCEVCSPGSYADTVNATSCTMCSPGSFSSGYGATACKECAQGSYEAGYGSSECSLCGYGAYASASGSRLCVLCSNGTFSTLNGSTVPCSSICDSNLGLYSGMGASSCTFCDTGIVHDLFSTCVGCGLGMYANIASQKCTQCPKGKYNGENASAVSVDSCKTCGSLKQYVPEESKSIYCVNVPAGFISNGDGDGFIPCQEGFYRGLNDSLCLPCSPGTISSHVGADKCTLCPRGKFQSQSKGVRCTSCSSSTVAPDEGMNGCISCQAGFIPQDGSVCVPCPENTYSVSDIFGVSCRSCSIGKVSKQASTDSSQCIPCAPYEVYENTKCTRCSAGKYSVVSHTMYDIQFYRCETCPAGTVNPFMGSISVLDCTSCSEQALGYIPSANKTLCIPCSAGEQAFNDTCVKCKPGSYSPNGIMCIPCGIGLYTNNSGESICQACPPGYFSSVIGRSSCIPCPLGTFTNRSNSSTCQTCTMELGYSSVQGASKCTPRKKSCQVGEYLVLRYDDSKIDHACVPCPVCTSNQFTAIKGMDTFSDSSIFTIQNDFMNMFCPGNETSPRYLCVDNTPEAGSKIVVDMSSQYSGSSQNIRVSVAGNSEINVYRELCVDLDYFASARSLVSYVVGPTASMCYVGCKYGLIESGLMTYADTFGFGEGENVYQNIFYTRMLSMAAQICSSCPLSRCPLGKYRKEFDNTQCGPPCMMSSYRATCSIPGNEDGCLELCNDAPAHAIIIDGSNVLGDPVCPWQCNNGYFKDDSNMSCLSCATQIVCESGYVPLPISECRPNSRISTLCQRCPTVEGGVPTSWDNQKKQCMYRCTYGYYSNDDFSNCLPCKPVNDTLCDEGQYKDVLSCFNEGKVPVCRDCTVYTDTVGILSFISDGKYDPDRCLATCKIGYNTKFRANGSLIPVNSFHAYSSVIKCEECVISSGVACKGVCFRGFYRNTSVPEGSPGACVRCKTHSACGLGKYALECLGNETSDAPCRSCSPALLVDQASNIKLRTFVDYSNPLPKAAICPTSCIPNYVVHEGKCISCKTLVQDVYKCADRVSTGIPRPCDFVYSHWNASDDVVWWEPRYTPQWLQAYVQQFKNAEDKVQRKGICWACPSGRGTLDGDNDLCGILPGYGRALETSVVVNNIVLPSNSQDLYLLRREPRKSMFLLTPLVGRRRLLLSINSTNSEVGSSLVGREPLIPCPLGYYKGDRSNTACTPCPMGTSTFQEGSTSILDCFCLPGHYRRFVFNGKEYNATFMYERYNSTYIFSFPCVECGKDRYRSMNTNDESKCLKCSENETTFNTLNATTCACKEGFIRNGRTLLCELCPRNHFCVPCYQEEKYCPLRGVHIVSCFPGSVSVPGSNSILNCTCSNGTVNLLRNESLNTSYNLEGQLLARRNSYCLQAPPYSIYDPVLKKLTCPRGWLSNFMNGSGQTLVGCSLCPPGNYAVRDPAFPLSSLDNGALVFESLQCKPCPIGTYSSSSITIGGCTPCPFSLITATEMATNVLDCGCPPTMALSSNGNGCIGCSKNQYIDETSKQCMDCPPNSIISANILHGKSIYDCICIPGYSLKESDEIIRNMTSEGCFVCQEGTYSTFASNLPCKKCPIGSTTRSKGARDVKECGNSPDLCTPGYKWVPGRFGCVNSTLIF